MKNVLTKTSLYELNEHKGKTVFSGCQCFKDCNCSNNFVPTEYHYYTVKRLGKKPKTFKYDNLQDAENKIKQISHENV